MVEVVNMEHVGKAKIKQELPGFGQLEECRKWCGGRITASIDIFSIDIQLMNPALTGISMGYMT